LATRDHVGDAANDYDGDSAIGPAPGRDA
jgi:hypothetical protein